MAEGGFGIEGLSSGSPFAEAAAASLNSPFQLVDVGCAGGLPIGWRAFGEQLAAVAYDPDAREIARLAAEEANPAIRYFAGYVGLPKAHPLRVKLGGRPRHHALAAGRLAFERTQALRDAREARQEPLSVERYFDAIRGWRTLPADGYDLDYTTAFDVAEPALPASSPADDGRILYYLPAHLAEAGFAEPDFLKIDVDASDFEILRGSGGLLDRPTLLGLALEITFVGSHDANDNTFHNVDRLMRAKGFDLFGLSVRPYASAALPSPYMDRHPGITWQGKPLQGDAIYLRDLASSARSETAETVPDDALLKLAALFALFGLPDQAAEVLLMHRRRLEGRFDVDAGLELLAREIQRPWDTDHSYTDWIARFENEDAMFFNHYARREAWLQRTINDARARPSLEKRLAEAETRAEVAEAEAAALRDLLDQRSTSPLRAFASRLKR